MSQAHDNLPVIVIRPRNSWQVVDTAELWRFRELIVLLASRDIRIRYKQTVLGAAWAILQPLTTMVIFGVFFGHLAGLDQHVPGNQSYFIYTLCALLPWQLFANALSASSNSLIDNQNLVTKVYFPRIILPFSAILVGLVDFVITLGVLLAIMLWQGVWPSLPILLLPVLTILTVLTALAVGVWLAALNTLYRDFRYTLPFITQVWLFLSPVAYPASIVPEKYRLLYGLNPMAGIIEGFRWSLLGTGDPPGPMLGVSLLATLVIFVTGLIYFRRMERTFADRI